MQQLEAPGTVQRDLLEVLDIEHRQTVNRGGLGAHPIVVDHGGSLSGKYAQFIVEAELHSGGSRLPATCCSFLLTRIGV